VYTRILTFFSILILAAAGGLAQEPTRLSVDDAIKLALKSNPELRIAAFEIARAKSRSRWSGRLKNPDFEFSVNNDFAGLDEDEAVYEIAFSQKFPVTARLKNESEVRRVQILLAEAEFAEQRRHLAYQVDQLSTEMLALQAKAAQQQLLAKLNDEIVKFLKDRAAAGEVSSLEINQALLEGRALARETAVLENQALQLGLKLGRAIGLEPGRAIELTGGLEFPDSRPPRGLEIDSILSHRPDHAAKLIQADVAQAELALENSRRWEDVAVKLFMEREHAVDEPSGLERNTFFGIGFSIPLPLRDQNEAGIEMAEVEIDAAAATIEASAFAIQSEIEAALAARSAAWTLAAEASGEIVKLAEKNLGDFREAHVNGQASLLQVQRAQEQLLEIQTASTDLERDYHLADAAVRFVAARHASIETKP
jgi:cobalt-zinc-cadmium efflux system outer membrane protein